MNIRKIISEELSLNSDELYSKYWDKMVKSVCYPTTKDWDLAKDLCQDGFMKAFKNLHKFTREVASIEGWLRTVIKRTVLDYYKRRRELPMVDDYVEPYETPLDPYEGPNMKKIMSALSTLSPNKQKIFKLYYVDELTGKEIAEKLGINPGTVKSELFKARKSLQKLLPDPTEFD